jgi:hypothetical protein
VDRDYFHLTYALLRYFILALASMLLSSCSLFHSNFYSSPKSIRADGITYTARRDTIWLYSPSRDVASSSEKTYEATFVDEFGHYQDVKDIRSYSITDELDATYAMPGSLPGPDVTTYSTGGPFMPGDIVLFGTDTFGPTEGTQRTFRQADGTQFGKNRDFEMATYEGPGDWKPVPCKYTSPLLGCQILPAFLVGHVLLTVLSRPD